MENWYSLHMIKGKDTPALTKLRGRECPACRRDVPSRCDAAVGHHLPCSRIIYNFSRARSTPNTEIHAISDRSANFIAQQATWLLSKNKFGLRRNFFFNVKFLARTLSFSTLCHLDEKGEKSGRKRRTRAHGVLHILLKIRAQFSTTCLSSTKWEGREKEGKDDIVSLTHEAIVCKNLLVRLHQTGRHGSISLLDCCPSRRPWRRWRKKKKRKEDSVTNLEHYVLLALETAFLRRGRGYHDAARGPRVIGLKNRYFCVFLSSEKMLLPTEIPLSQA